MKKHTRWTTLHQLGKSFDLYGILSPFFVKLWLILQLLIIEKYDWDHKVPELIVKERKVWF